MDPVYFNWEHTQLFEAGAVLLTIIAYPEPDADARRGREHSALCREFLRREHRKNAGTVDTVNSAYAFGMPDRPRLIGVRFETRLTKHVRIAGSMLPLLMKEAGANISPKLPSHISAAVAQAMNDVGENDEPTFRRRFWYPMQPIAHIACAFYMSDAVARAQGKTLTFLDLMTDQRLLEDVVALAEQLEPLTIGLAAARRTAESQ